MYFSSNNILITDFATLAWLLFSKFFDIFCRVFADRLTDEADKEIFVGFLSDKLGTMLDFSYHNLCPNKVPPMFGEYFHDLLIGFQRSWNKHVEYIYCVAHFMLLAKDKDSTSKIYEPSFRKSFNGVKSIVIDVSTD